jgi:methyl-accepting chemotaxis protein
VGVEGPFFPTSPGRTRRDLPIGYKVWLGVGGLLALVACSIAVAVFAITVLRGHEQNLNERAVPYANAIAAGALDAKAVANDERGYLLTGDTRFVKEADRRIWAARASFAAAAATASDGTQQRVVAHAHAEFERWVTAVRHEFDTFGRGDRRSPIAAALGPNRALRKHYEAELAQAQTLAAQAIRSGDASVAAASSRSIIVLLAYLVASLAIGLGVAYWMVRTIATPLARLLSILGPAR